MIMCIYLNFTKSKDCFGATARPLSSTTMVPSVYCHVVARKSCSAGKAATLRCRLHTPTLLNNEKNNGIGLDLCDLWKTKSITAATPTTTTSKTIQQKQDEQTNNVNAVKTSSSSSAISGFKRWRKTNRSASATTVPKHNSTTTNNNTDQNVCKTDDKNRDEDMSLLKFLAINALDLTVPASDILLKNRSDQWFQLSGHPDSLAPAGPGTVWKKSYGADNTERQVYEALSADPYMHDVIPTYFREVEYQGEKFIELQDLLYGFNDPNVMDIKMGTRTFLECEVEKTTARCDLYKKMILVDPNAPTADEHLEQAVTKLRYMQFREQQSSSCSQGFRLEAMKCRGSPPVTDLKTVKSRDQVIETMRYFLAGRKAVLHQIVAQLKNIRYKFEQSEYFRNHEVIGSSVFMLYDDEKVGVWLIDFAKTRIVPNDITLTHRKPWIQGNHEEGFLFGLDKLISVLEEINLNDDETEKNCNGIPPPVS